MDSQSSTKLNTEILSEGLASASKSVLIKIGDLFRGILTHETFNVPGLIGKYNAIMSNPHFNHVILDVFLKDPVVGAAFAKGGLVQAVVIMTVYMISQMNPKENPDEELKGKILKAVTDITNATLKRFNGLDVTVSQDQVLKTIHSYYIAHHDFWNPFFGAYDLKKWGGKDEPAPEPVADDFEPKKVERSRDDFYKSSAANWSMFESKEDEFIDRMNDILD